jgi:uncharacterized coiled-coil DUF342 family protein
MSGVFEMTDEVNAWMREMSEKVGTILAKQEAHGQRLEEIKEQTTKTNGRVTNLEQWRWKIVGAATVIAILAKAGWDLLVK